MQYMLFFHAVILRPPEACLRYRNTAREPPRNSMTGSTSISPYIGHSTSASSISGRSKIKVTYSIVHILQFYFYSLSKELENPNLSSQPVTLF